MADGQKGTAQRRTEAWQKGRKQRYSLGWNRRSMANTILLDKISWRSTKFVRRTHRADAAKDEIIFEWHNITAEALPVFSWKHPKKFPLKKERIKILASCSGKVQNGEMHLLLGQSGGGKTVLLHALAGRRPPGVYFGKDGHILINGKPRDKTFFDKVAFVEASTDILDNLMTVQESMEFTSILGAPTEYQEDERLDRIKLILTKLGLIESSKTRIEYLSHGEKKRLCIAQHLLRDPKLIILDEPTTGLDSTSARILVSQLHQLTVQDGLIMIMSLHQSGAESFERFTTMTLIARGNAVYEGRVARCLTYMCRVGYPCAKDINPAEFLIDLLNEKNHIAEVETRVTRLIELWSENINKLDCSKCNTGGIVASRLPCSAGWWTQFRTLTAREAVHFSRSGKSWWLLMFMILFISSFIGFIWFQIPLDGFQAVQNRIGVVLFIPGERNTTVGAVILISAFLNQVRAERSMGLYQASAWYAAILTFYCGLDIIINTIYATIVYYMSHLRYEPITAFFTLLGLQALLLISAFSIGVIIPFLISNKRAAAVACMTIWYLTNLYSGRYVNFDDVTWILRWPCYLSPKFYYFNAALQNEFIGQIINGKPGIFWLEQSALIQLSVMWSVGALLIIDAACILASYATVKFRTRPHLSL